MSTDSPHRPFSGEIMVVDDNKLNVKFLSEILTQAGYRVRPANDGELALRGVRANLPDLILLDIKMPGMSGIEVCRLLKGDPGTRDLPVIFISALGETEMKVLALEAGGADYITKPFEPSEVLARIRTHLDTQRLQRRLMVQSKELIAEIEERNRSDNNILFQAQLLESVRESIVATDLDGCVTYWGKGAEALYGYRAEEVMGKVIKFVADSDGDEEKERMKKVLENGEWHGQSIQHRKDGTLFWCDTTISLVSDLEEWTKGTISIDRDITEEKRVHDKMKQSLEQLRMLAAHVESVREENRAQIARELHDELGHALTGLKIETASLEKKLSTPDGEVNLVFVREKLASMSKNIDTTIASVRRIATELRPGMLDDLGLMPAVEWQIEEFQERTGIMCETNLLQELQLDEERTTAVFRILQEALTNITRHAKATKVRISMLENDGNIILEVSDNGKGISEAETAAHRSFGLLGIRERAILLNGDVSIKGIPGVGTTVKVRIPPQQTARGGKRRYEDSPR